MLIFLSIEQENVRSPRTREAYRGMTLELHNLAFAAFLKRHIKARERSPLASSPDLALHLAALILQHQFQCGICSDTKPLGHCSQFSKQRQ